MMIGVLLSTIRLADSKHTVRATPSGKVHDALRPSAVSIDVRVATLQMECNQGSGLPF